VAGLRYVVAAVLAGVFTLAVFGFLRSLTTGESASEAAVAMPKVEFVRLRREVEIEEKKREKPERVKPQQTPGTPTVAMAKDEGFNLELDVQAIAAGLGAEFGSAGGGGGDGSGMGRGALAFNAGMADRGALPLVRVEPQYPPAASRRGLEGWVQLRFTISTAGSVKDAIVVSSSNSVFDRAALQAVNKWKYQPQMQSGKPVESPDNEVVLRFEMEG
jgi:protein TonB